jgi:hypothetical protein
MPIMNMKRFFISVFLVFAITFSFAQTTDSTSTYHAIHYKGSVWVGNNEQFHHCQVNFVNVIDSFLYIHLNVAGIEIGRALATPTHILFINKLQKEFYEGDYSIFQKILEMDIDFYMVQNMLNGLQTEVPFGVYLSYEGELLKEEYPLFKTLLCQKEQYSLELEIKKVTFNDIPEVSATIPKSFKPIVFQEE